MVEQINKELATLRDNLKDIDSARLTYKEVGKKATSILAESNLLIGKHDKVVQELHDTATKFQKEREDIIATFEKSVNVKLEAAEKKLNTSVTEHLKNHEDILTKFENTVNEYITKYGSLVDATNELTTEIKGVNFPQRLDKLDSTVSGINIGLQNLQSKVIQFDEKFSDVNKEIKESANSINEQAKNNSNRVLGEIEKSTEKITKETENTGKLVLGEIQKVDDKTENLNNNLTTGFKQNTNLLYGIGIIQLIVIIVMIVLHFI